MKLIQKTSLPGCIQSLASSRDGGRVLAAVGTDWQLGAEARQRKCAAAIVVLSASNRKLEVDRSIPLDGNGFSDKRKSTRYTNMHVALRDARTAVVARLGSESITSRFVELTLVDLAGQRTYSPHTLSDRHPGFITGLCAAGQYLLLGTQYAIVCLDSKTLEEVCRTAEFNDDFEPLQDDLQGEESFAVGGFVWDERRKKLFTLMGYYGAGVVFGYSLDARKKRLIRNWKREVVEMRPSRKESELLSARCIRLAPDGRRLAATFLLEDLSLDREGRPVTGSSDESQEPASKGRRGQRSAARLIKTARLGWLGLFDKSTDQWIEIPSDLQRDFDGGKVVEVVNKRRVTTGYRLCSKECWLPEPVAWGESNMLITSPSGLLIEIDILAGTTKQLHDLRDQVPRLGAVKGPVISAIHHCAKSSQLLIGCSDGTLLAMDASAAKPTARDRTHRVAGHVTTSRTPVKRAKPRPRRVAPKPPVTTANSARVFDPAGVGESLAITPDGKIAACGINVWDVDSGQPLLVGEDYSANVALSRDGTRLLVGKVDGEVAMWSIAAGNSHKLWRQRIAWKEARGVAMNDVARVTATGHNDKTVRIWDFDSGNSLAVLAGHTSLVNAVAFNRDGSRLVSASDDNSLRIWNYRAAESKRCERILKGHTESVVDVAWSVDGRHIVSASWDETLRVWDPETGKCLRVLKGHSAEVECVVLTPDGATAVSGSIDRTVRLWDFRRASRAKAVIQGFGGRVRQVVVAEKGVGLVTTDGEPERWGVERFDWSRGKVLGPIADWGRPSSIHWERDGKTAVTCNTRTNQVGNDYTFDHTISVWDVATGTRLAQDPHPGEYWSPSARTWAAVTTDQQTLLTVATMVQNGIRVWKTSGHTPPKFFRGHSSAIVCLAIDPHNRLAVSGDYDGTCHVWEIESTRLLATFRARGRISDIAFAYDGRTFIAASDDEKTYVCTTKTGECRARLVGDPRPACVVGLDRTGGLAAGGNDAGTIFVWNVQTQEMLHALDVKDATGVVDLIVNRAGTRVLAAYGLCLRVWDVTTGQPIVQFEHEGHSPRKISLSPDELTLSSMWHHVIRQWQVFPVSEEA